MSNQEKLMIAAITGLGLIALYLALIAEAMLSGALRPIVHVHPAPVPGDDA